MMSCSLPKGFYRGPYYHCATCGNEYYFSQQSARRVPERNKERLIAAALRGEVHQVDSCYRCSEEELYSKLKDDRS
jgi:hypothetical protein